MKNKKIISIIILLIGLILIGSGIFFINLKTDNDKENNDSNIKDNNASQDNSSNNSENAEYNELYSTILSLYGGEGKSVELKEEDDKYIIYVKNENGELLNIFNMDKETGSISEQPFEGSFDVHID